MNIRNILIILLAVATVPVCPMRADDEVNTIEDVLASLIHNVVS